MLDVGGSQRQEIWHFDAIDHMSILWKCEYAYEMKRFQNVENYWMNITKINVEFVISRNCQMYKFLRFYFHDLYTAVCLQMPEHTAISQIIGECK